jgi:hypothetical protein
VGLDEAVEKEIPDPAQNRTPVGKPVASHFNGLPDDENNYHNDGNDNALLLITMIFCVQEKDELYSVVLT